MNPNRITLVLLLSVTITILGQEPKEKTSQWAYDGFSYADFGTGEEHSYFSVLHQLNAQFHVELRGF